MRLFKVISLVVLFFSSLACAVRYGAWLEQEDWRYARKVVLEDLAKRKLNPLFLGSTEIIENENQPLQYGFSYKSETVNLDYSISFGGSRGVEMSVWDYARDEKN